MNHPLLRPERAHYRPTVAVVDLNAIVSNFHFLRGLADPGAFFCPMVKANAYGHGDVEVARVLRREGATHLGVATIEEGIGLRESGDKGIIVVFCIFFDDTGAREIVERCLTPVVSSWDQLACLEKAVDKDSTFFIHLKFNTGMNRLGFPIADAPKLREWLSQHPNFRLEGICTHLFRGDDAGDSDGDTYMQFSNFVVALGAFEGISYKAHALNSAATVSFARSASAHILFDRDRFGPLGARPGISLYGAQASERVELQMELKPAMTLKSSVILINRLRAGEVVSYGAKWSAKRESWIGVVPIGYGDGYMRIHSNKSAVLCRGHQVPIVGAVCMDYLMIDMTDVMRPGEQPLPGEEIVLIGEQGQHRILADDLAQAAGTISYEILTRVGERVPRHYIWNEKP
jgi:alanine racemase